MKKTCVWACILFTCLGSGCVSLSLIPPIGPLLEKRITGSGKEKVLLLDISGVITEEEGGGIREEPSPVARVTEALAKASRDPRVKALVLRINSPGGTVTASDIIHREIMLFKQRRKIPVVASIMDLGTSGGYYVALSADRIVAHPTSVTGSIGVIMLGLNLEGLLQKIGITETSVKSGEKKDMGSPFRAPTPEEREIFQGIIDSMFERFVTVIVEGRRMERDTVRSLSDGRVFTAQQARQSGLIDQIGYLDDAIEEAKKMAGLEEAVVVLYQRPDSFRPTIYSRGGDPFVQMIREGFDLRRLVRGATPGFWYLWVP